jgi:hypothetical protein
VWLRGVRLHRRVIFSFRMRQLSLAVVNVRLINEKNKVKEKKTHPYELETRRS